MNCQNLNDISAHFGCTGLEAAFFGNGNVQPGEKICDGAAGAGEFRSFIHKAIKVAPTVLRPVSQHHFNIQAEVILNLRY